MTMMANVKETKEFLDSKLGGFKPEVALVVGSRAWAESRRRSPSRWSSRTQTSLTFPQSTVAGHAGQMIFGEFAGKKLMVLSGRFHFYEGRSLAEITYPDSCRGFAECEDTDRHQRGGRHQPAVQARRPDDHRGSHQLHGGQSAAGHLPTETAASNSSI